jgi:pilus assembly protein CpaE
MAENLKSIFIGKKNELFERFADEVRPVVEITEWIPDPSHGFSAIRSTPPDVVFIDFADDPSIRLNLVSRIVKALPGIPVFPVASVKSSELILEAFRRGAVDFLVWPGDQGEALAVVRRVLRKGGAQQRRGEICSLFSIKGGQGVTSLALNLADHIHALTGESVIVFDLNLYAGDIGARLDILPLYTPFDLQKDLKRLDRDLLFSSLLKHERGFHVLIAPDEISDAEQISSEDVSRMLDTLSSNIDYVLLDLPHDFSPRTMAALDASDRILLIVQQDVPVIKNTLKVLQFFRELGYSKDKIALVVNRHMKSAELKAEDLAEVFSQPIYALVGNDYRTMIESVSTAKTVDEINPKSSLNLNIKALAGMLTGMGAVGPNMPFWKRVLTRWTPGFNGKK